MKKQILKIASLVLIVALALCAMVSCVKSDVYVAEMEFENFGTIRIKLLRTQAPATVDNFVKLAESGFYDGLTIIRAQEGFVIQGGCPEKNGMGDGPNTIPGEFSSNGYYKNHISHKEGVISMARGEDPDSASCQFFITLADSASRSLDGSYAAFGYVEDGGMEIVHKVAESMYPNADSEMGFVSDVSKQVVIKSVRIVDSYNID